MAVKRGLGVDASGGAVIDPTENVIALVKAGLERQDDMRKMQAAHTDEVARLRSGHAREVRDLDRDNAAIIRQVDIVNSRAEWDRSQQAIQALAKQTSELATTMAKQTSDLAATIAKTTADSFAAMAKQMTDSLNVVTSRLAELEKASYKGEGKATVVDPQMAAFMAEVRALAGQQASGEGKVQGKADLGKWFFAGIAAIGTLVGITGAGVAVIVYLITKLPQ